MRAGSLLAAVICFSAAAAFAAMPEDEPLDATPEFERARVLHDALALITPTPLVIPAITVAGNVLIPSDSAPLSVTRDAPLLTVPERCREDAKAAPRGTIIVCAKDDRLYKLATEATP